MFSKLFEYNYNLFFIFIFYFKISAPVFINKAFLKNSKLLDNQKVVLWQFLNYQKCQTVLKVEDLNPVIGCWTTKKRETLETVQGVVWGDLMQCPDFEIEHQLVNSYGSYRWTEIFQFNEDLTFKNITLCLGFGSTTDGTTISKGSFRVLGNQITILKNEERFSPATEKGTSQKFDKNEENTFEFEISSDGQILILRGLTPYSKFYRTT
jgi:hypothetical protein